MCNHEIHTLKIAGLGATSLVRTHVHDYEDHVITHAWRCALIRTVPLGKGRGWAADGRVSRGTYNLEASLSLS